MRFLSVCSGIEAASVAWEPLGWRAAGLSEIEAFPRSVLQHRLGAVAVDWDHRHVSGSNMTPLFGDFTQIEDHHVGPIDLLVGGTPCQSFSIAGLRGGLDDDRGNLALEFLRLADRTRPRWLVWENVPGVLSSGGGRDFGSILGGLVELGYGFAYRVLDAQYFGVPQRRRRVFVVGYLGDWRRAAAVLFERQSLSGHPAPRREKGKAAAALTADGVGTCGADDNQAQAGHLIPDFVGQAMSAKWAKGTAGPAGPAGPAGDEHHNLIPCQVAHSLRAGGFDASEDGTGRGTPIVPVAQPFVLMERGRNGAPNLEFRQDGTANAILTPNGGRGGLGVGAIAFAHQASGKQTTLGYSDEGTCQTLGAHQTPAVAFSENQQGAVWESDVFQALNKGGGKPGQGYPALAQGSAVRRLTPRECERLQGFPDDWTDVPHRGKPAADGPRYKALGNSMAVPVMRWIGERIAMVDALP